MEHEPMPGQGAICVVMATYNGTRFLTAQLESIASQTRKPDSLVIVDDASCDSTVALLEDFAASAGFRVDIHRHPRNLGFRRTFEEAIRRADGELIVLSDQDDVWRGDRLSSIESVFRASPQTGLVFSDAELVDEGLRPTGRRLWETIGFDAGRQRSVREGRAFEVLSTGYWVTGATLAFRARYRDLVLPLDPDVVHDTWIALLLSAIADVEIIPEPLVRYRQHDGNQIGAGRVGALSRLARARALARRPVSELLGCLRRARERLEQRPDFTPQRRASMDETIEHLEIRLHLPRPRLRRIPPIYRELARGRYAERANGVTTALRDLLV